jgi:hypothetical protein
VIIEWLIDIGVGIAEWASTLFPTLDLPAALVNVDDGFNSVMAMGSGLGAFVDFPLIGLIAGVPITVWLGGLSVRAARALIAHLPFIGGRG